MQHLRKNIKILEYVKYQFLIMMKIRRNDKGARRAQQYILFLF